MRAVAISGIVLALVGLLWFVSSGDTDNGTVTEGTTANPADVYNPVAAGESLPPGFRQLLSRDAIRPIYSPEFLAAADVSWHEGALVIGVELEGEAKAYPVSYLNRREMVIDRFGDIPILVTW